MGALDTAKIAGLAGLSKTAPTSKAKGDALEELICDVFEAIPGISVSARNKKNVAQTEEIDIAFFIEDGGALRFASWMLLVECKNWSNPVGSEAVSWFDTKLRHRGVEFGILVAVNGITGDSDSITAAHSIVSQALGEKRRLVVITLAELLTLSHSDELVKLIKTKLCELVVRGSAL